MIDQRTSWPVAVAAILAVGSAARADTDALATFNQLGDPATATPWPIR